MPERHPKGVGAAGLEVIERLMEVAYNPTMGHPEREPADPLLEVFHEHPF